MAASTAVQDFRDTGPRLLRLDPLLLLATLGLTAASVYTVRRGTLGDIPGGFFVGIRVEAVSCASS